MNTDARIVWLRSLLHQKQPLPKPLRQKRSASGQTFITDGDGTQFKPAVDVEAEALVRQVSWKVVYACEHLQNDSGATWRSFLTTDLQRRQAAQQAVASALYLGAIDDSSIDAWANLAEGADDPAHCDLPSAAADCQEQLREWWEGVNTKPECDMIETFGQCFALLRMLRHTDAN